MDKIPFSELFADTLRAFGVVETWKIYRRRPGMTRLSFRILVRSTLGI